MTEIRVRRITLWRIGVMVVAAVLIGLEVSAHLPRSASAADVVGQAAPTCGDGFCDPAVGEDACTCSADCTGVCSATTGSTDSTLGTTGTTGDTPTGGAADGTDATGNTGTTTGASPTTGGVTDSTTTGGTTDSAAPTTGGASDSAASTTGGATDGSAAATGGTIDGAAPTDTSGVTTGMGDTAGAGTTGSAPTTGGTSAGTGTTNNSADPTSGLTNGAATGTTGTADTSGGAPEGSTTSGGGSGIERLDPRLPDGTIDPIHPTMLLVYVGGLIFAAVAIPAFMKNARKAKTAEAVTNVKKIYDGARMEDDDPGHSDIVVTKGAAHDPAARLPGKRTPPTVTLAQPDEPAAAKVSKVEGISIKQTATPEEPPEEGFYGRGVFKVAGDDPVDEHFAKAVLYGRKSGDDKRQDYMEEAPDMPDEIANPVQEHIKKAVLTVRKQGTDQHDYGETGDPDPEDGIIQARIDRLPNAHTDPPDPTNDITQETVQGKTLPLKQVDPPDDDSEGSAGKKFWDMNSNKKV